MKYLEFSNKDKMPALGLGTWKSAKGEVYQAVRKAIELGYRHIDCAHVYGNEQEIGEAFTDAFAAGDVKREELWITSKLWNNSHRKEQVIPALKQTLSDLKLDYLDLYLIHWPVVIKDGVGFPTAYTQLVSLKETPLEETWAAMVGGKEAGLTKHIGVSNFNGKKIDLVAEATGVFPEVNQVEMHPFFQQSELKAYCDSKNIIMTAYSPLGSSDRPANRIAEDEPKLFTNETILSLAKVLNCSAAQVMLAWAVSRGTSVIPKSVNPVRLAENLAAADIELSADQIETITNIGIEYRFIKGDFWCLPGSDYTFESLWNE